MKEPCVSCGHTQKFLRKKGNPTGLYCQNCGKWVKWVGKKEVNELKHKGYKVHPENYIPTTPETQAIQTQYIPTQQANQSFGLQTDDLPDFDTYENDDTSTEEAEEFYTQTQNKLSNSYREPSKQQTNSYNPCPTCVSHAIDPISKNDKTILTIMENTMTVTTKNRDKYFGAFAINFCPTCGVKL